MDIKSQTLRQAIILSVIDKFFKINKTGLNEDYLQFLIYFIQGAGVSLDYRFELLFYGPFSEELNYDVLVLLAEDKLNSESQNLFIVEKKLKGFFGKNRKIENNALKVINNILLAFKGLDQEKIRLLARIYYIYKSRKQQNNGSFKEKKVIEEIVSFKKPEYGKKEIEHSFLTLRSACLI